MDVAGGFSGCYPDEMDVVGGIAGIISRRNGRCWGGLPGYYPDGMDVDEMNK